MNRAAADGPSVRGADPLGDALHTLGALAACQNRLEVLLALAEGPGRTLGGLTDRLSLDDRVCIWKHLRALQGAGVVDRSRFGNSDRYSLSKARAERAGGDALGVVVRGDRGTALEVCLAAPLVPGARATRAISGDLAHICTCSLRPRVLIGLALRGEAHLMELARRLGRPFPNVSHHLCELANAGLIARPRFEEGHAYSITLGLRCAVEAGRVRFGVARPGQSAWTMTAPLD